MKITARVMELPADQVERLVSQVLAEFHGRHHRAHNFLLERFDTVREHLLTDSPIDEQRKLLIGAYFTQEYSLESAALFNPSMVWHPHQGGLPAGSKRFVLS
jgi:ATP adenylyltransferase/5',5'''-P-1,P-4-tetraphosphate phosphorylase II